METSVMKQNNVMGVFDHAPGGIFMIDLSGKILYANEIGAKRLGRKPVEILGTPLRGYFPPDIADKRRLRGIEALKTGKPQKIEDQVDGRWYASTIFPVKDETSKQERLTIISRDISDHKQKEQALLDSERKYRTLVDAMKDWVWSINRKGEHTFTNGAVLKLLGYAPDEILNRSTYRTLHPESAAAMETILAVSSKQKKGWNGIELKRLHKDGAIRIFESTSHPDFDENGQLIGFSGIDRDVTRRKHLEEQVGLLGLRNLQQGREISARPASEKALKESEIFLENLTDIAYSADAVGNVVWVNSAIEKTTGLPKSDIIGKPFQPLFMEEDHASLMDVYHRTLKGESLENTLTFITGVTCDFTSLPRRDNEGKIVGVFGIARNITEKLSTREALEQSKDRLKRAQRVAKIGSWEYDIKAEKVWGSEEAFRIYGIERKSPFLPLDEVENHILEPERVNQALVDLVTRNEPYDIEFEIEPENRPGLTVIHSIAELICDIHGNPLKVLGVIQDITDQKQMREVLKQSEEKYRAIFENKGTASGIFGEDGIILECNVVFEEMSGYKKAEIVDKMKWSDFVLPEDLERLLSYDAKRSKEGESPPPQYECRIRTKAGENKTVIVNINLVGSYRIVTLTDITDRKKAEEEREKLHAQLLQSQKMESIGTLAGGIAHDFNNILSSILGYSELALLDLPPESPMRNKLEAVYTSGEKAQELVAQILAFGRNDEQVRSPIELHLAVEDALKLLRHAIPSTIRIQTEIDSKCRIMGDPSRINQVIMNLCTNAYQAMLETGGTLDISLSRIEMTEKASEIAGIPNGFYGKLVIADTGIGIPTEQLERIFEPYFTTKEKGKGTGLGLAVVHGIVKTHKGAILVKSEVGKGTQFDVYLPLTRDEGVVVHKTAKGITRGSERILIVDDQEDVLQIETEMLETLGYDITGMTKAQEALDHFAGDSNQYDLVITDMTMPDMTGDRLAEQLRRVRPDIPIVLATGFSELISREKAESMGLDGFLTKPVQLSEMSEMIRKVIDGKSI